MTTPFIRLVAARPYSAANVEASTPDIIIRRLATSERTMTPATASDPMTPNRYRTGIKSLPALALSTQHARLRQVERYHRQEKRKDHLTSVRN